MQNRKSYQERIYYFLVGILSCLTGPSFINAKSLSDTTSCEQLIQSAVKQECLLETGLILGFSWNFNSFQKDNQGSSLLLSEIFRHKNKFDYERNSVLIICHSELVFIYSNSTYWFKNTDRHSINVAIKESNKKNWSKEISGRIESSLCPLIYRPNPEQDKGNQLVSRKVFLPGEILFSAGFSRKYYKIFDLNISPSNIRIATVPGEMSEEQGRIRLKRLWNFEYGLTARFGADIQIRKRFKFESNFSIFINSPTNESLSIDYENLFHYQLNKRISLNGIAHFEYRPRIQPDPVFKSRLQLSWNFGDK